jgi:hypothetical protein
MTSVVAPYGLLPVKKQGSRADNAGVRHIRIASGYATSIFYGDVVKLASGVITKDTGTATATPVGVFLGCYYTDATYGLTFRQNWTASTVAADAYAMVCDDPDALFSVALVSGTTVIAGTARASLIGKNAALVQNAGSATTGKSAVAASGVATTATLPLRIVDVVPGTEDASGNFTAVLVKWNAGMHQYNNATGV